MVLKRRGGLLGDLFLTGSGIILRYKKGFKGFSDAIKKQNRGIIPHYKKGKSSGVIPYFPREKELDPETLSPGSRQRCPADPTDCQAFCISGRYFLKKGCGISPPRYIPLQAPIKPDR